MWLHDCRCLSERVVCVCVWFRMHCEVLVYMCVVVIGAGGGAGQGRSRRLLARGSRSDREGQVHNCLFPPVRCPHPQPEKATQAFQSGRSHQPLPARGMGRAHLAVGRRDRCSGCPVTFDAPSILVCCEVGLFRMAECLVSNTSSHEAKILLLYCDINNV